MEEGGRDRWLGRMTRVHAWPEREAGGGRGTENRQDNRYKIMETHIYEDEAKYVLIDFLLLSVIFSLCVTESFLNVCARAD